MKNSFLAFIAAFVLGACTPAIPYPSADPNTPSRVYYGYDHLKSQKPADAATTKPAAECPCMQKIQQKPAPAMKTKNKMKCNKCKNCTDCTTCPVCMKDKQSAHGLNHSAHNHQPPNPDGVKDHYADMMAKMHRDMAITPTGDVEIDFMRGMIPHHQGAIDMAEIVLREGKDPYVRRLAMDILVGQHREIAYMEYWLHNRKFPDSNIGLRAE